MRHLLTCSPRKLQTILNMRPKPELELLIREILEYGYGLIEVLNEKPTCFGTKIITHWHKKHQFALWGAKDLTCFYY